MIDMIERLIILISKLFRLGKTGNFSYYEFYYNNPYSFIIINIIYI